MAQKNLDRYQNLEDAGKIPVRVEGIAYEYLNVRQISQQYVSSVVTYSSGDSRLEDDDSEENTGSDSKYSSQELSFSGALPRRKHKKGRGNSVTVSVSATN